MESNKKEWLTIGAIALIIVLTYVILMNFQVIYWKHQNIAYEQYKAEDLRQARIYNKTFANTEEQLLEQIQDMPETDKNIAKAVYAERPAVNEIKQRILKEKSVLKELEEDLKEKNEELDNLNEQIKSETEKLNGKHNILGDTKTSLKSQGIYTLEQYVLKYDIKGNLSSKEYEHIYNMFVQNGNSIELSEFTNVTNKYSIGINNNAITYASIQENLIDLNNQFSNKNSVINSINNEIAECNAKIETIKLELNPIKEKINKIVNENSIPLEYQETIITNGLKTAGDYLCTV